jgi:hypothetical protein
MALTDENSGGIPATMLVGPTGGYPAYQGGNGGFGNDGGWWIVLLIIVIAALGGNWGGNNGIGGGQPIIVNDGGSSVQRGFDQAAVIGAVNGVQAGVNSLSAQLCNCCGDMRDTVNSNMNALQGQLYANTIADLERSFASQTASTQGMTALQSQLAQCCCDNRLATESLRATVLSENCADRYEASNNTRDIIDSQTRSTQAILDKLCQLELDGYKRENDNLRSQLNSANLAASQTRQTADIQNSIINELRSCPIPAMPVYGSQPIFTCPNNSGCGCGCGSNF